MVRTILHIILLLAVSSLLWLLIDVFITTQISLAPSQETSSVEAEPVPWRNEVIGYSHHDLPITAYHFGTGRKKLLLVGGIHGGYEWNTVVLAEEMVAHFKQNHHTIPSDITVIIIPVLNPDGLVRTFSTTTLDTVATATITSDSLRAGRRNGRDVDLNRNFDCNWQPTARWQGERIGAGSAPFSEPEAAALRDFVLQHSPMAAIVWHSQAGAVYGATCSGEVHQDTLALLSVYARNTSYDAVAVFSEYPVSGDVESWLTTIGVHALTVELESRTKSEFEENLTAVQATMSWLTET